MNRRLRNHERGFTLVEMLVVLALTTLLLGLLFGPIFQSFKMTQRSQAMTELQETARLALEQMTREISDAMYIYDTWTEYASGSGYAYDMPTPAVSAGYTVRFEGGRAAGTYIDLVLPKDLLADNGSGQIKQPLQPEERIVRYFIGLQDLKNPAYVNRYLTPGIPETKNNLYVLYRWEFNPFDKNDPAYDPSAGSPTSEWRSPDWIYKVIKNKNIQDPKKDLRLTVVIPANRYDLVRAKLVGKEIVLNPGIRFWPTKVAREAMAPMLTGEPHPDPGKARIPTIYSARSGNWTGQDAPPATVVGSPHILVFENAGAPGSTATPVYDSFQASNTQRHLTWDRQRGIVDFGDKSISGTFNATPGTYVYPLPGVPIGERPVPGSLKVTFTYTDPISGATVSEDYREVPDPPTQFTGAVYSVNYDTNELQFNELPASGTVSVSYSVQNNKPTDSVYVTYQTTSLITVTLNLRKYGPDSQPVGIQLATKVKPRNLFR